MLKTNLPREYFTSTEIFATESERIFGCHWICAGHVAEFPPSPSYRVFQVGDYSVVVTQSRDGRLQAFHNVCRHRGAQICSQTQGPLENDAVTCPYHAWTYDAAGRLIGAPNMSEQDGFDRAAFPLLPVSVVAWNGFVMLHLQKAPDAFEEDYGQLHARLCNWRLGELVLAQTLRYHVRCNWKLLFQNYSECYHCPTVHPALNRLTPYRTATNDLTHGPFLGGPMELDASCATVSRDGQLVARELPELDDRQRRRVYYYTVFPTMFVSLHPDYAMVHVLTRRDRSTTDVACHFLMEASKPSMLPERLSLATGLWDEINRQDWEMCERTQLGAESPAFRPGPYSRLESMVAAFDEHYLATMNGGPD
jgi:Rieske 2Fe-2S family protein